MNAIELLNQIVTLLAQERVNQMPVNVGPVQTGAEGESRPMLYTDVSLAYAGAVRDVASEILNMPVKAVLDELTAIAQRAQGQEPK